MKNRNNKYTSKKNKLDKGILTKPGGLGIFIFRHLIDMHH